MHYSSFDESAAVTGSRDPAENRRLSHCAGKRAGGVYSRGFTFVELLVVLAVLGVLLAIAVPNIAVFGNRSRLTAMSNDVLGNLYLARSEAIKRRGRVALCKSADGVRCAAAGGWEQGWIVFHDADNDGTRSAAEIVLQRMGALPPGWHVAGNANITRYISYHPSGTTKMVSGAFQAGTLTVCRESALPTEARQLILSAVGRPRIVKTIVSQCT